MSKKKKKLIKHKAVIISLLKFSPEETAENGKLSDFAGGQMMAGLTLAGSVSAPQPCKQEVTLGGDWKAVAISRDDGMGSVWSTWTRSPAAALRPRCATTIRPPEMSMFSTLISFSMRHFNTWKRFLTPWGRGYRWSRTFFGVSSKYRNRFI